MDAQINTEIPQGQIADKAAAEHVAYAEKPIRDALIDHADDPSVNLTPEGREGVERLADAVGDEALRAYQESLSMEDPRLKILRDEATSIFSVTLTRSNLKELGSSARSFVEAQTEKIALETLRKMVEGLGPNADWSAISYNLESAALRYANIIAYPANPQPEISRSVIDQAAKDPIYKAVWECQRIGSIVSSMAHQFPNQHLTTRNLKDISELKNIPISQVMEEQMDLLIAGRPLVQENLDVALSQVGYMWNQDTGRYISMAQPQTPVGGNQ